MRRPVSAALLCLFTDRSITRGYACCRATSSRLATAIQARQQRLDPLRDLVPSPAHGVDRAVLRIGQVPIDVTDAGHVGAPVATAHRDHDIGPFCVLRGEELRPAVAEVDA